MKSSNLILTGSYILDDLYESREIFFSAYFFLTPGPSSLIQIEVFKNVNGVMEKIYEDL